MEGFRKRIINTERCPHCGGKLKIITAIEQPSMIAKILDHLGLSTRPLRCAILASLVVYASYPGVPPP